MESFLDVKKFYDNIVSCYNPEDLFGVMDDLTNDEKMSCIHKQYKDFLKLYHPDKYVNCDNIWKYYIDEICGHLAKLVHDAEDKILTNKYNKKDDHKKNDPFITFNIDDLMFNITSHEMETDLCDVYFGNYINEKSDCIDVCYKIVRDKKNNKFIENEIGILKNLHHKHMPYFVKSFMTKERQRGIITRLIPGYDLFTIKEKYVNGLPSFHACWILERLLSVLGFLHSNMVIHGNIEPGNIIVNPLDHNVTLIDYKFSLFKPKKDDFIKCETIGFTSKEVKDKKSPIPESDIFSLGKTMIFLLGGDIITNKMPYGVDPRLEYFILEFVKENPLDRPSDSWKLWHFLRDLRKNAFGAKKFIIFDM